MEEAVERAVQELRDDEPVGGGRHAVEGGDVLSVVGFVCVPVAWACLLEFVCLFGWVGETDSKPHPHMHRPANAHINASSPSSTIRKTQTHRVAELGEDAHFVAELLHLEE